MNNSNFRKMNELNCRLVAKSRQLARSEKTLLDTNREVVSLIQQLGTRISHAEKGALKEAERLRGAEKATDDFKERHSFELSFGKSFDRPDCVDQSVNFSFESFGGCDKENEIGGGRERAGKRLKESSDGDVGGVDKERKRCKLFLSGCKMVFM